MLIGAFAAGFGSAAFGAVAFGTTALGAAGFGAAGFCVWAFGAGAFGRGGARAGRPGVGTSARNSWVLVVGLPPRVGPLVRAGSAGAGASGEPGAVKSCEASGASACVPF